MGFRCWEDFRVSGEMHHGYELEGWKIVKTDNCFNVTGPLSSHVNLGKLSNFSYLKFCIYERELKSLSVLGGFGELGCWEESTCEAMLVAEPL